MTPPNDQQFSVDELARLHREATPGPWNANRDERCEVSIGTSTDSLIGWGDVVSRGWESDGGVLNPTDADLIVYLRNNADEIIRRLRRAERAEKALREIANEDYRGNRPRSAQIASAVLKEE